jgi:hypothetical protein
LIVVEHIESGFSLISKWLKSRCIYRLFLVSLLGVFIPVISINAQTGPGGVGNSTSNRLWLKANAGVYVDAGVTPASNSNSVQQWNDFSGNNNHANQSNNTYKPVFRTGIVNGEPAIEFNGTKYIDPGSLGIPGTGSFSYVIVFKVNTGYDAGDMSSGNGDFIIDRYPETNGLASLKIVSSDKYGFQKRTNSNTGLGGPISVSSVNTSAFTLIDYMRERGTAYRLFLNGTQESSLADGDGDITPPNPRIGRHSVELNNGLNGYISELLIYNYKLNNAQINIVNSYLAAKYGLTIANDKYSYDATHKYEVAGLGWENGSNYHNNATSGGILNISNPSKLDHHDYLLFGHDNGSIAAWSTSDAPSGMMKIDREWRFDASGDIGDVDVTFDVSSLPATPCGKYFLLIDDDGNFTNAAVTNLTFFSGTSYKAAGIKIANGKYVSIGVLPAPSANITPDPAQICAGGTLNLNGNPSGGSGTFTAQEALLLCRQPIFRIRHSPQILQILIILLIQ